jgi:hypothetical protein
MNRRRPCARPGQLPAATGTSHDQLDKDYRHNADVSEFRLRILMQRSASSFAISNTVRGTWLSTGTHLWVGQIDALMFVNSTSGFWL